VWIAAEIPGTPGRVAASLIAPGRTCIGRQAAIFMVHEQSAIRFGRRLCPRVGTMRGCLRGETRQKRDAEQEARPSWVFPDRCHGHVPVSRARTRTFRTCSRASGVTGPEAVWHALPWASRMVVDTLASGKPYARMKSPFQSTRMAMSFGTFSWR